MDQAHGYLLPLHMGASQRPMSHDLSHPRGTLRTCSQNRWDELRSKSLKNQLVWSNGKEVRIGDPRLTKYHRGP